MLTSSFPAVLVDVAANPKKQLSASQLGQLEKTRQKLGLKNSWKWRFLLVPATVWQILNMKRTQRLETEAM